jgi:NAD kinase
MTKRVGLVIRPGNQKIVDCAGQVLAWCSARNIPVDTEKQTAHILQLTEPGFSAKELVERADPIVTLGGDGTLIGVARYVRGSSPVFVGVTR